jgi:hypothetical protein
MNLRKSLFILSFLLIASCFSDTDTEGISTTSQTLSNEGLQFLATISQQFHDALEASSDCTSFNQALNNLVSTQNCSLGGSQSSNILNSSCVDSPSFSGQGTLSILFQDCREPGQTIGGTVEWVLDWDGSLLITSIQTSDYSFNGIPYSITDLTIQVGPNGAPECTGTLLSQGDICGVTPDCNFCPF